MKFKKFFVEEIPRRKFLETSLKGGIALAATPTLLMNLVSCKGVQKGSTKVDLDPQVLSKVIAKALEKGGEFADVYVENRISRRILMEESKFKSAVFGISQGAGVRVISGDKTGFAYTDEITDEKMMRAAEIASFIAQGGKSTGPVNVKKESRESYVTVKLPLEDIVDEKRIDVMKRANQAALDYDSRIKMASISYYDEIRGRTVANSEGLLLSDELPLLFFIVQTLGVGNNTRHMGRERLSRHSGFEMFAEVTPEEVALTCARESIAMLEAQDAPAGIMDVVMQ
ncbi:MAG: hypothetical protein KAU47_01040, partial [Candidatus Aminicenantes bacterium]|nr:hypothetical protein [Candidatus Aminicenantes bacterium]